MAAAKELLRLTARPRKHTEKLFDGNDDESDSEEGDHDDLLKKIKSLDKKGLLKRHKGPLRSELNQNVSEFHLKSEGDHGRVNLDDLVGSLQSSSYHSKLKKSLESLQKMGHTVEVPLAKPAAERIQRVVAYEETSKDISKWNATVQKNRRAEQLSFPLDAYKPAEMSTTTLVTSFKPRTPLEQEIASVLQTSSQMLEREDKELSLEEEEALKNMSLEEALERRHELQKLRALQSYYEQKCRRMKKIKSKKYHRIKRKAEKKANSKQTFELLQKENPELAQTELDKAEKLRIEERMSLKHRNTSKWAKNIITKGMNDVQSRQALSEQLRISRQLTENKTVESDSEEDEGNKAEDKGEIPENFKNFGLVGDSSENPWLLNDGKEDDMNKNTEEPQNTKERLRKPKAVTAKETDGGQAKDANSSDNSDQDETFELVDVDEVRETGKKARKGKKKISAKEKKSERKGKKLKRVEKGDEDMVKTKEKIKRKKKTVASKRNTDEVRDVKMKVGVREEDGVKKKGRKKRLQKESTDGGPEKEPERKKKKRKSSEEMNEVSKRNKKAKMLLSSGIEDVQKETGEDMTFGNDDEQLLIEGDGIQENESFQTQDTEVIDSKVTVADGNKRTLNPKNVFQIEDLGKENDLLDYADCDSDDETRAHRMTIQEAFANDDVIEEFVKEKEDTAEASKPKEVDLSLPGWGDWGGPGIDETKRKKKFKVPSKPTRARKDTKLAHVIINEDRDKKFAKNQVSQLPFPFTSYDQWEHSVRVPLGKDWNTASVHQKLVKPRVTTLPGTIIEPIKSAKGMQQTAGVDDCSKSYRVEKRRAKSMGSGIVIHN